jgi:hypothetical protein
MRAVILGVVMAFAVCAAAAGKEAAKSGLEILNSIFNIQGFDNSGIPGFADSNMEEDSDMADKKKGNGRGDVLSPYAGRAYARLLARGMRPVQAAGAVANLMAESGMRSDIWNREGSKAWGLQQWMGPRLKNMQEVFGTEKPSFDQQIDYVFDEYSGRYPGLGWNYMDRGKYNKSSGYYNYSKREFDSAETPELAALAWNQGFGRPGKHELANDRRAGYARMVYDAFAKGDSKFEIQDSKFKIQDSGDFGDAGDTGIRGFDDSPIRSALGESYMQMFGMQDVSPEQTDTPESRDTDAYAAEYAAMRADIERKNREMEFVRSLMGRMNVPIERRMRDSRFKI